MWWNRLSNNPSTFILSVNFKTFRSYFGASTNFEFIVLGGVYFLPYSKLNGGRANCFGSIIYK